MARCFLQGSGLIPQVSTRNAGDVETGRRRTHQTKYEKCNRGGHQERSRIVKLLHCLPHILLLLTVQPKVIRDGHNRHDEGRNDNRDLNAEFPTPPKIVSHHAAKGGTKHSASTIRDVHI